MTFIGRWSNIGFRLSALSLIIVLSCALSTGAIGYFALRANIKEIEQDFAREAKLDLLLSIASKASANEAIAVALSKSDSIQGFLRNEDRPGLIESLDKTFKALSVYDINNIHFHRPNMRTFARLHAPTQYDDDLSLLRPMIAEVIKMESPRRGIELGVNGLPIRGATPIVAADGTRLGAVEVGSFLNAKFLADIEKQGIRYRFHLQSKDRFVVVAETQSMTPPAFSIEALRQAMEGTDTLTSQTIRDERYVSIAFPLRDYADKAIGVVEIHIDAGSLDILSAGRIQFFIAAILALVIFSVSATMASTGSIFHRLDQLIASVKAIAAGASRTPPPFLERGDGFGDLARAIEGLRETKLELGDALKRAEASDRSKSEFLSVMSHELRTPLNAIIGFSEMIALFRSQNMSSPEKELEYINHIQTSGRHLLSIIEDILTISSLEAGQAKPARAPLDLRDDIEFVVTLIKEQSEESALQFSYDLSPNLPMVPADSRSIRQILLNLLGNALKFTPPPGEIALSVEPSGDWIEIRVTDTGPGIAPEHLENVRKAFFQLEQATARRGGGVGLGLSIAQALVAGLDGTLELSNRPQGGLEAIVRLPIASAAPEAPAPEAN